jgi:hypothetical protein
MATGMLVRAIKDHCPPIFGFSTFKEVANNGQISRSHKDLFKRLDESLTKIADMFLHQTIRKVESLPSPNQMQFQPELDALLAEIEVNLKG